MAVGSVRVNIGERCLAILRGVNMFCKTYLRVGSMFTDVHTYTEKVIWDWGRGIWAGIGLFWAIICVCMYVCEGVKKKNRIFWYATADGGVRW